MSDCISRDAAMEIVKRTSGDYAAAFSEIRKFPAADVEPVRRGNWHIRFADEMTLCLECSVCGRKVDNIDLHHLLEAGEYGEACRRYPYCHCGAKMCLEGENNDD